jgi:hypothetical protein
MQRPETFSVCVACPCADADKFSTSYDENFLFGKVSCEKKIRRLLFDNTNTYRIYAVPEEPGGVHAQEAA